MSRTGITRQRRDAFLGALAATGNVSAAARAAGVARWWLYALRGKDAGFAALWRDAEEEAVDLLEAEARRRAVDGIEEPLMGGGKLIKDDAGQVVTIRRYNDRLLEFLLKAHRPDKYRDRSEGSAASHASLPAVRIVVGPEPDAEPTCETGPGAEQ